MLTLPLPTPNRARQRRHRRVAECSGCADLTGGGLDADFRVGDVLASGAAGAGRRAQPAVLAIRALAAVQSPSWHRQFTVCSGLTVLAGGGLDAGGRVVEVLASSEVRAARGGGPAVLACAAVRAGGGLVVSDCVGEVFSAITTRA